MLNILRLEWAWKAALDHTSLFQRKRGGHTPCLQKIGHPGSFVLCSLHLHRTHPMDGNKLVLFNTEMTPAAVSQGTDKQA